MSEATPLQPEQTFAQGRFVLVKRLGRGGMGEVWLARDERLNEPVALKFLPPEIRSDLGALDDLRRETSRSRKLTHPNIVRIHDLHEEADGMPFIVMEYVDGPTLAGLRVEQETRVLSWEYLCPLVQQLCAALDYAHGEKVVHRDLKPANVMVDSKGRLKLADFGIAAVMSDSMSRITVRQTASGTLVFMSPQQLAGKSPQAADDIYALGATLYELLTSKTPFYTGDLTHQILHEPPEPISERLEVLEVQNEVPPDVSAMIMACLAKEREQRPPSASAVAEWIGLDIAPKTSGRHLAGLEGPPSARGQLEEAPPLEERKSAAWLVGGVLAALLVVGMAAWYLGHRHKATGEAGATATLPVASAPTIPNQDNTPTNKPKTQPLQTPPAPAIQHLKPGTQFYILAGQPDTPGWADGQGSAARFNNPRGVAFGAGAVYVADTGNHTIRKITPGGVTTTVAGSPGIIGFNDGLASKAHLNSPEGIFVGGAGAVRVVDTANNTVRTLNVNNRLGPGAGQAGRKGSADGGFNQATFNHPTGIEMRGGITYIADTGNHTIRRIIGTNVNTLAGRPGESGSTDGYLMEAHFNQPMGVTAGQGEDVYVADTGNNTIRKISAGIVIPLAGKAGSTGDADGKGNLARFNQPRSIRWQNFIRILYVEDAGNGLIRMVTPDGLVSTLGSVSGDLALDPSGNLYVADYRHHVILTTVPTGVEFTPPVGGERREAGVEGGAGKKTD